MIYYVDGQDKDEICTWCRFVETEETGRTVGCKKGRKNSGNNNRIPCVGCKKFVVDREKEMPYFQRREAETLQ